MFNVTLREISFPNQTQSAILQKWPALNEGSLASGTTQRVPHRPYQSDLPGGALGVLVARQKPPSAPVWVVIGKCIACGSHFGAESGRV